MALTPGTRLGVYEITAKIGEGGMGEVYRVTDESGRWRPLPDQRERGRGQLRADHGDHELEP